MKFKLSIFFILGLVILNIFAIKNFYFNVYGNELFNNKLYSEALDNFSNAENIYGTYNKGNSLYKENKYDEAIKKYLEILTDEKNEQNFSLNHNLGNSYYKFGEKELDNNKKIKYWEESVKYYKQALEIKYNEETKQNLDFVLNKINEEKKKQDEKIKDEQDKNKENKQKENKTGSGENSEKEDKKSTEQGNKEGEKKDGKSEENQVGQQGKDSKEGKEKNNGKESNKGEKQEKEGEISKEQEESLKQYEEALKQAQKQNSDSFNKVYQDQNINDPFQMFNDPFFNNDLLNNSNGKKDW